MTEEKTRIRRKKRREERRTRRSRRKGAGLPAGGQLAQLVQLVGWQLAGRSVGWLGAGGMRDVSACDYQNCWRV